VSTLQGGGERGYRVDAEGAAGGHIVAQTFQKIIRSGERDAEGNLPPEVWAPRDVSATLNCRDNTGESQAADLVVQPIAFAWQAGGNNSASGAFEHDMTPTLPRSQTMAVLTEKVVRRLTPLEWERLQGFPDGWTATSNGRAQADSARYRQMGNAVAVPCVEWIARRIAAVDGAA
jgi:DNA (cytosine-5)-methyltransferase 1